MGSENIQLTHLKERLTVLLSTHLPNLPHQILTAVSRDVLLHQDDPSLPGSRDQDHNA